MMKFLDTSLISRIRCFNVGARSVCKKVDPVYKRSTILNRWIKSTDTRKNWHFEILQNNAKSRNVFEKVSRPSRRQTVLNSLFIKNVTDVISTREIPEILGFGIEITGVKIAPCCKMANVYWQTISTNPDIEVEDIGLKLNLYAPKIRAELISRNVMGRVPHFSFVRDITNSYKAAFEKALKEADLGPENEKMIVPDDIFTSKKKKMYRFDVPNSQEGAKAEEKAPIYKKFPKQDVGPLRPPDMRTDMLGLKHDNLMNKVMALKTLAKSSAPSHVIIAPNWDDESDLFSKIPGTTIHEECDRGKLLKQFYIERKKIRLEKGSRPKMEDNIESGHTYGVMEEPEPVVEDEDYIEEETTGRF